MTDEGQGPGRHEVGKTPAGDELVTVPAAEEIGVPEPPDLRDDPYRLNVPTEGETTLHVDVEAHDKPPARRVPGCAAIAGILVIATAWAAAVVVG